jgi:hypothetical protein
MTEMKEELLNKLELHMRVIQDLMDENIHLDDSEYVQAHIDSIKKYWKYLDDGDKDYIDTAQYAIENRKEWL